MQWSIVLCNQTNTFLHTSCHNYVFNSVDCLQQNGSSVMVKLYTTDLYSMILFSIGNKGTPPMLSTPPPPFFFTYD